MNKNRILGISAIVFLMILIGSIAFQGTDETLPLSISVGSGAETEQIAGWKDEDGDTYFFLPGYADLADAMVHKRTDDTLYIDSDELSSEMTLERYETGKAYRLVRKSGKKTHETTITFLRSANLPAIYIDTQSGSMEYIHTQKGNEESGAIRLYDPEGELCYSGKIDNMNGRGNASWVQSDKKAYSLTLEMEADLLGMGAANRWILLANALDPSNIRNKLASRLASDMGLSYTAESEWVDLYLNGTYAGLYLLSERNEVHPQRLNISQSGFLVSMESQSRLDAQYYPYVQTEQGLAFRLHYPSNAGMETRAAVASVFQSLENAILSGNGIDPITGKKWDSLIDADSWARMFLISEIIGNLDSFKVSQYFYSNGEDGLIYAGPIWDSDKALGNDDDPGWSITNPDTFVVCRYLNDDFVGPRWVRRLLQNEQFYEKITTLFRNEFYPQIEMRVDGLIQQYKELIASSFEMNRIRWQNELSSGSLQEETAQVGNYIHEHMQFLHRAWIENVPYCQITFRGKPKDQFMTVVANQTLQTVPVAENTEDQVFLGWYYEGTEEPFDPNAPITEDISLYAKWGEKSVIQRILEILEKIVILVPLGVIGLIGTGLLVMDIRRVRKNR